MAYANIMETLEFQGGGDTVNLTQEQRSEGGSAISRFNRSEGKQRSERSQTYHIFQERGVISHFNNNN